jgi:hypothetical protein
LFIAGLQVPEISFKEVVGKGFIVAPEQIGATCVNIGRVGGVTVTVADPVFPVPVNPPPVTDIIVYVEVVIGLTGMLTVPEHVPVAS